jgi:hypothetical protein
MLRFYKRGLSHTPYQVQYKQYACAHVSVASQAISITPVIYTVYFYYPE